MSEQLGTWNLSPSEIDAVLGMRVGLLPSAIGTADREAHEDDIRRTLESARAVGWQTPSAKYWSDKYEAQRDEARAEALRLRSVLNEIVLPLLGQMIESESTMDELRDGQAKVIDALKTA